MALNIPLLAADIATGVGSTLGVTPQIVAWATGIITEILTKAIVNNITGTVIGVVPPSGGPLITGSATSGIISGMTGTSMANFVQQADPVNYPFITPQMLQFCEGIVQHIQTIGTVVFVSETISGTCTNTLITPGAFTGVGVNGKVTLLNGSVMATLISTLVPFPGTTPQLIGKCDAIANHILINGQVSYATVTGSCSAGGGSLIAGTASGGKII